MRRNRNRGPSRAVHTAMTSALRHRRITLPSGFKSELRGLLWHCVREGMEGEHGMLMVAMWSCSGDGGWPSVRTLAGLSGWKESALRRALDGLEKEGEVVVTRNDKGMVTTAMLAPRSPARDAANA